METSSLKIVNDVKLDYDDVLIKPKSSETASRRNVELFRTFHKFPHTKRTLKCVPIMASNMDTIGTIAMAESLSKHQWITCLHKYYSLEELIRVFEISLSHMWYTLGITDNDIDKLCKLSINIKALQPNLCIDVANGYTDFFVSRVAHIRELYPDSIIMAGNVATPEMVERLIRQGGADIVKIGIGPGSTCTTRLVTGVGYPQLSATLECADAAHGSSHGYICADGGCRTPGDICKAFGANADFVMIGNMLAGTNECEGDWTSNSLKFSGMSSYDTQIKHHNYKDYRASEGRTIDIPCKGSVENVVQQIEGGIRSCCAYIGADNIKHIGKCTTFIRVNRIHNENSYEFESKNQ